MTQEYLFRTELIDQPKIEIRNDDNNSDEQDSKIESAIKSTYTKPPQSKL